MNTVFTTPRAYSAGESCANPCHFKADARSRHELHESIKPHGVPNQDAALHEELEAYPKCS